MDAGLRAPGLEDPWGQGEPQGVQREGGWVLQVSGLVTEFAPQQSAAARVRVGHTDLPGGQQISCEGTQPNM
jgi:hypothetical protein